jgi:hypothetical protein
MHVLTVLGASDLGTITGTHEVTWEQLAQVLGSPVATTKAETPLVIGAKFTVGARRSKATLEARTVIPVDVDSGMTLPDAVTRCKSLGLAAIVHTTASHTPDKPHLRVFIPLSRGVSAAEWDAGVKDWIRTAWPEADTNALDAARVSYAPMKITGYRCELVAGDPLEPPAVSAHVPSGTATAPMSSERVDKLVALFSPCMPPVGHRHEFYLALTGFCAKQLLPLSECNALVIALCSSTGAADKIAERLGLASGTYAKQAAGGQVGGLTALESTMAHAVGNAGAKAIIDQAARVMFGSPDKAEKEVTKRRRRVKDTNHVYSYPGLLAGAEKVEKTTVNTLAMLLDTDDDWRGVWQKDTFADRLLAVNPPFKLDVEGGNLTKTDIERVRCWFSARGYRATPADTEAATELAASQNEFHPVLEYLDSCPKGSYGAIDRVAKEVLRTSEVLHATMLRKFLISACKRVLRPGCQVDTALILVGRQGAKKTSFCRWLFGDWLKEDLSPLDSKQCVREMQGSWGVELAELDKVLRAERDVVKSFVSRRVDSLDRKYQRERSAPRSCVLVGTTNQFDFLRDETGERRWWPLQSDAIDLSELTDEMRNAAWGEAYEAAKRDEQHWLTEDEEHILNGQREQFRDYDPIEEKVEEVLSKDGRMGLGDIITKVCVIAPALIREGGGTAERTRVLRALRRIGAKEHSDGRKRVWVLSNIIPIERAKDNDAYTKAGA